MKVKTTRFHRWMALFLCIVMFASLLPVGTAFAEDAEADTEAIPVEEAAAVEEQELTEEDSSEEPEASAAQEIPEEPAAEEFAAPAEAEEPAVTEEPAAPAAQEAPAAEVSEAAEEPAAETAVRVSFVLSPAEASVSVFVKDELGEKKLVPAEADGSYLLVPGQYFYAVSCEGFVALDEETLTVAASEETLYVSVTLAAVQTEEAAPAEEAEQAEEEEVVVVAPAETAKVKSKKALMTPVLKSAVKSGSSVKITWEPVPDAEKYRVFRMGPSDTAWKGLGNTTAVSYTDSNVSNGVTYKYTVRCISADGKTYTSGFDTTGLTCTYWTYATPKLTSVKVVEKGVTVSWQSVGSGVTYRVYHWGPNDSTWVGLTNTTATSYTDTQTVSGKTYKYTVRAISSDGKTWLSYFNTVGLSITYYSKAQISSLTNQPGGVMIEWAAVPGVTQYQIERKITGSSWDSTSTMDLGVQTGTSYKDTDTTSATNYTYRIKSIVGGKVVGTFDETGKSITFYDAPQLEDIESSADGLTIYWHPVTGVSLYRVFRLTSSNTWAKLADVKTTQYTDTTAVAGKEYTYTVRCMNPAGTAYISGFDTTGITYTYTNVPVLKKAETEQWGIRIYWEEVEGATTYGLYRKQEGATEWQTISESISGTGIAGAEKNALDSTVQLYTGTKFFYTVRCLDPQVSAYDEEGVSATYYPRPDNLKAESVPDGINVTWKTVDGAPGYRVFRKIKNGSWQPVGDSTTNVFTDDGAGLTSGVTYYYTVCVLDKDGEKSSDYNTAGASATYYGPPEMVKAEVTSDGIMVTWKTVADAPKYQLYRKTSNSNWVKLSGAVVGVTDPSNPESELSYEDKTCVSGTTYSYAAVCLNTALKEISDHDPVGVTATYIGYDGSTVLSIKEAVNKTAGIQVSWNVVDEAVKYRLYRRELNTAWVKITDTTATSYVDTTAVNGATYQYTVCVLNAQGQEISNLDENAKEITRRATPVLVSAVTNNVVPDSSKGTVTVTWKPVDFVTKYNVYYKIGSGSWTLCSGMPLDISANPSLVDTATNTIHYVNTPGKSNLTIKFTVRCAESATDISDVNNDGVTVQFLQTPELLSAVRTGSGIKVSWRSVDGAEGYKVYRKLDGSTTWSLVKTVSGYTNLTWTDTSALSGSKYTYTVRAYKNSGSVLSGFHDSGISAEALAKPSITSVTANTTGIQVTWNAVANAKTYNLYYRNSTAETWKTVKTGITGTSYTHTGLSTNKTYYYCVEAVGASASIVSAKSDAKSLKYVATPVLSAPTVTSEQVTIKWGAVTGAVKYRVFRKTGTGGWAKLADTTETSYTDKSVAMGTSYTYTVRCITSNGSAFTSSFDTTGKTANVPWKCATPVLQTPTVAVGSVTVKWNAVSGAEKYRVYRKTGTETWKKIGETTGTSFKDTKAEAGVPYTYTVRCITSDGAKYTSYFDTTGKTVTAS
ncbi:MAG: hypothetical protein IJQ02_07580 [Oscillospiraceae bacterium]|nr:hypothetical protein [Oscillospiraceae bacterium]